MVEGHSLWHCIWSYRPVEKHNAWTRRGGEKSLLIDANITQTQSLVFIFFKLFNKFFCTLFQSESSIFNLLACAINYDMIFTERLINLFIKYVKLI